MKISLIKKIIDKIFDIGILLKAIFGFFELFGGLLLAFSTKLVTDNFIIFLAQQEITDDPNDLIANYLIKTATNLAQDSRIFAVTYLFFHGAVNIVLTISLAKKKLKAYLWAITIFGAFIIYQIYRYFHTYSLALLVLILFDILFVAVIWLEYKKQKTGKII
jgi:uncharacterized membrane protein